MNRVAIKLGEKGEIDVIAADSPVEVFIVCDHTPNDRVYQITSGESLKIGVSHVRELLRDDPVGHLFDDQPLGLGYGPRKPPSRPKLNVVKREDD